MAEGEAEVWYIEVMWSDCYSIYTPANEELYGKKNDKYMKVLYILWRYTKC